MVGEIGLIELKTDEMTVLVEIFSSQNRFIKEVDRLVATEFKDIKLSYIGSLIEEGKILNL